jgi:hypothetical protein
MMIPDKLISPTEFRELTTMIKAIASGDMTNTTYHVWHNVNGKAEKLPLTLKLVFSMGCGCGAIKTEYGILAWRCDEDDMARMFSTLSQLGVMGIHVPLWRFEDERT